MKFPGACECTDRWAPPPGAEPARTPVGLRVRYLRERASGSGQLGGRLVPLCRFFKGRNHERSGRSARPARGGGPVQRGRSRARDGWRRGFNRTPVRHRAAATVRAPSPTNLTRVFEFPRDPSRARSNCGLTRPFPDSQEHRGDGQPGLQARLENHRVPCQERGV